MSYSIVGNTVTDSETGKTVDEGSSHSDAVRAANERSSRDRGRGKSFSVPEMPWNRKRETEPGPEAAPKGTS